VLPEVCARTQETGWRRDKESEEREGRGWVSLMDIPKGEWRGEWVKGYEIVVEDQSVYKDVEGRRSGGCDPYHRRKAHL
jgi:hypothetical protein